MTRDELISLPQLTRSAKRLITEAQSLDILNEGSFYRVIAHFPNGRVCTVFVPLVGLVPRILPQGA